MNGPWGMLWGHLMKALKGQVSPRPPDSTLGPASCLASLRGLSSYTLPSSLPGCNQPPPTPSPPHPQGLMTSPRW
jgi:hypothetical protein